MNKFHYLARGIIVSNGKVLVARAIGQNNTFLPGGHIEIGERAEDALLREITEETGKSALIKRFLGAIEHTFAEVHYEINLLFQLEIAGCDATTPVASKESHLEFLWLMPNELSKHNLQPAPLIELITNLDVKSNAFWASTIK